MFAPYRNYIKIYMNFHMPCGYNHNEDGMGNSHSDVTMVNHYLLSIPLGRKREEEKEESSEK